MRARERMQCSDFWKPVNFAQIVCHDYVLLLMEGVLSKFVTEFPYENLYAKCNFNIKWEMAA